MGIVVDVRILPPILISSHHTRSADTLYLAKSPENAYIKNNRGVE